MKFRFLSTLSFVLMATPIIAFAQPVNVAPTMFPAELTSVVSSLGIGGLVIWFCLKWVQSESQLVDAKIDAVRSECSVKMEAQDKEHIMRMEEAERRWRHDLNEANGNLKMVQEIRITEAKEYGVSQSNSLKQHADSIMAVFEMVKGLTKLEMRLTDEQ